MMMIKTIFLNVQTAFRVFLICGLLDILEQIRVCVSLKTPCIRGSVVSARACGKKLFLSQNYQESGSIHEDTGRKKKKSKCL